MNDKINAIIINMEKETEKYKTMKEKLDKLDFCNYKRFEAINGKNVYKNLLEEGKIYPLNEKRGIYVNNKMVGCWQSHYTIWKNMVDNNIQKLLIFEDDCNFKENFVEKYNKTMDLIKDKEFDILFLGYSGAQVIFNQELHLLNTGCPKTTHSYILTLSGAKILIERMNRLNWPIDEIIGAMFNKKILKGYRTSELLVWQPWQWDRNAIIRKKYFNY